MAMVMILGASGLIGHQLFLHLKRCGEHEVAGFGFRNSFGGRLEVIDVRDVDYLRRRVDSLRPRFIINAVGELISGSKRQPASACYLNGFLPHLLEEMAIEFHSKLVHISTDCVFSGVSNLGYSENDTPDGVGIYPQSKALGELISDRQCILRTSVVGPELGVRTEELFNWFMFQGGTIRGYRKAIWSGVTTIELAKAVEFAINHDITGLHHVTNGTAISKYELLLLFKRYSGKDVTIAEVDGTETNKTLIDAKGTFKNCIPSYDTMIRDMFQYIRDNQSLFYAHYELGRLASV